MGYKSSQLESIIIISNSKVLICNELIKWIKLNSYAYYIIHVCSHCALAFPLFIQFLALIRVVLNREDDEGVGVCWTGFLSLTLTQSVIVTSVNDEEMEERVVSISLFCVKSLAFVDWTNSCNSSLSSIGSNREFGRPFVPWRRCLRRLREYFLLRLNCHWNDWSVVVTELWPAEGLDVITGADDELGDDCLTLSELLSDVFSKQCLWSTQLEPPDLENAFKEVVDSIIIDFDLRSYRLLQYILFRISFVL